MNPAARKRIRSFDGTRIAARRLSGTGPPLLVVPAVGAGLEPWRAVLDGLSGEVTPMTWELRGLHRSSPPTNGRLDAAAHAEDAVGVAEAFEIDRFHVAAWSNAGRIALELAAAHPERVASLSLVCASYGSSLGSFLRHLSPADLLPALAGAAKHFAPWVGAALRGLASRPELAGLLRQSGMLAPSADTPALAAVVRSMAACDPRLLLATFEAVAGDPAPGLLSEVRAPALVVAGGRDQFVPRAVSEQTATSLGARLVVYEEATHFLPLEFPQRLAADLRWWLRSHPAA